MLPTAFYEYINIWSFKTVNSHWQKFWPQWHKIKELPQNSKIGVLGIRTLCVRNTDNTGESHTERTFLWDDMYCKIQIKHPWEKLLSRILIWSFGLSIAMNCLRAKHNFHLVGQHRMQHKHCVRGKQNSYSKPVPRTRESDISHTIYFTAPDDLCSTVPAYTYYFLLYSDEPH